MQTLKIELTESERWVIIRALAGISSPEGVAQLVAEFPDIDLQSFAGELESLARKFKLGK